MMKRGHRNVALGVINTHTTSDAIAGSARDPMCTSGRAILQGSVGRETFHVIRANRRDPGHQKLNRNPEYPSYV
jgi:hypothetical protein